MKSGWAAELVWIFWKVEKTFVFCVLWDQFGNQKYKQDMNYQFSRNNCTDHSDVWVLLSSARRSLLLLVRPAISVKSILSK